MGKITSISHLGLRDAIIELQQNDDLKYYGFFAMYFNFFEDEHLPAAAGVTIKKRQFQFHYNVEKINEIVERRGKNFLIFLVIHECQHILLNHQAREGERNHKLANIAQDMVINYMIKKDHQLDFPDFYYSDRDYDMPKFEGTKYTGKQMFEEIYELLIEDNPDFGDDQDGECESGEGDGDGDGQSNGKGKRGQMVDDHTLQNENGKEMTDADKTMADSVVREIHESLKARGMSASEGIENAFNFTKKKPIVNVFKKVFGNGKLKSPTYRKLSRRHAGLKGKRKESKDVNIILDTSGSLYSELDLYMSQVVGNWNCYVIQVDTSVKFAGHVKNMAGWKKVSKCGGGGTTLQPALDKLIEEKRQKLQTIFVSDFYCEELDLTGFKAPMIFVKSAGATEPKYRNAACTVKTIQSQLEVNGNQR